jgi:beta-lactamase superfamily II metal-dependent hydrolase
LFNQPNLSRRHFLAGAGATLLAPQQTQIPSVSDREEPVKASLGTLTPWHPGWLDIHHISTGRGSCAFLILPDATTLLIDCGDIEREPELQEFLISPKPNGSLRPGQWVARYIQRHLPASANDSIDYFIPTHFHNDHMGSGTPNKPFSTNGLYRLSGVTDVAEVLKIRNIIDRNYPGYNYPEPLTDLHQLNYQAFVHSVAKAGTHAERIQPGVIGQIALVNQPKAFPNFAIRNLAANGEVWTGLGDSTQQMFPPLKSLSKDQYPNENMCSVALRLNYGAFSYYTGGDLTFETNYDIDPWRNIEVPVAHAAGPVTVAVANHHGFVNACSPDWVRALRPQTFIINAWTSAHPVMTTLDSMFSPLLYPGPRAVYSTAVRPESRIAVRRLDEMKSHDGHIVIRVTPGGAGYQIVTTSNRDESDQILTRSELINLS